MSVRRTLWQQLTANVRQTVLLGLTVTVVLGALVVDGWVFPAWDRLSDARERLVTQTAEYDRLETNLSLAEQIETEFDRLQLTAPEPVPDEIALSDFLSELESAARYPSMTLVNMRPIGIERGAAFALYRVRLAVNGKLHEVARFAADLGEGESIVGVESFRIQAVAGWNTVECVFNVWGVRLSGPRAAGPSAPRVARGEVTP